jgi:hypothetical protein
MLDHVLVPLDGSDLGEEALIEAKRIVSAHSRITLVMAVKDGGKVAGNPALSD